MNLELSKIKTQMRLRDMNYRRAHSGNEEVVNLYRCLLQWGFPNGREMVQSDALIPFLGRWRVSFMIVRGIYKK